MGLFGPPFIFPENSTGRHPRRKRIGSSHDDKNHDPNQIDRAAMIVRALVDSWRQHIFGYPGGAVLPIYDEIFQQDQVEHILCGTSRARPRRRGYARSTGSLACAGDVRAGRHHMVTPLTGCADGFDPAGGISGQVPTHLIGNDAFQEYDTVGITRPAPSTTGWCATSTIWPSAARAFYVASHRTARPVLVDVPKDVQFAVGTYHPRASRRACVVYAAGEGATRRRSARPWRCWPRPAAGDLFRRRRHQFGLEASSCCRTGRTTGFPITHLMGLGAYRRGPKLVGMLACRHLRSHMAMHGCDAMLCVGAPSTTASPALSTRFSPDSKKIHIDIDPSSINRTSGRYSDIGRCRQRAGDLLQCSAKLKSGHPPLWQDIAKWRARNSLSYRE